MKNNDSWSNLQNWVYFYFFENSEKRFLAIFGCFDNISYFWSLNIKFAFKTSMFFNEQFWKPVFRPQTLISISTFFRNTQPEFRTLAVNSNVQPEIRRFGHTAKFWGYRIIRGYPDMWEKQDCRKNYISVTLTRFHIKKQNKNIVFEDFIQVGGKHRFFFVIFGRFSIIFDIWDPGILILRERERD